MRRKRQIVDGCSTLRETIMASIPLCLDGDVTYRRRKKR